jgi:hypothetical protein
MKCAITLEKTWVECIVPSVRALKFCTYIKGESYKTLQREKLKSKFVRCHEIWSKTIWPTGHWLTSVKNVVTYRLLPIQCQSGCVGLISVGQMSVDQLGFDQTTCNHFYWNIISYNLLSFLYNDWHCQSKHKYLLSKT